MRTLPAGKFKDTCLKTLDQVAADRKPVVITKWGRPVARLVPAPKPASDRAEEPTADYGRGTSATDRLRAAAEARGMTPETLLDEMLHAYIRPRITRDMAERAMNVKGYAGGDGKLADNHDEEYALAIEERWK